MNSEEFIFNIVVSTTDLPRLFSLSRWYFLVFKMVDSRGGLLRGAGHTYRDMKNVSRFLDIISFEGAIHVYS